jgi:hypothetical protein
MKHQTPARRLLRPGQSLRLHVAAGTTLIAMHGTVRIDGTADWRDGHMMRETLLLQEGEAHMPRSAGWIVISAQNDAELLCIEPTAKKSALHDQVIALLTTVMRGGIL